MRILTCTPNPLGKLPMSCVLRVLPSYARAVRGQYAEVDVVMNRIVR
ncbi:MAG: hypothetical protein QOJ96_454 [Alphaproteobacteria bacterium]|jgi:hypothetical protein|nr:hypothetical protein [Alphaproteobacteria bacterium]